MSHAILVVHGVGDHQKTDTLRRFSNGFIGFLYRRLNQQRVDPNALQIEVDLKDPEVRLKFTHNGQVEDFIVRETWWARVFQPPNLSGVFQWVVLMIIDRFKEFFRSFARRPSPGGLVYAPLMLALMAPVAALLFLIIFGLRLILLIPGLNQPIKSILSGTQRRAADFLVNVVGDVQVYATDWVYSTEIRQQFEEEIASLVRRSDEVTDIHVVGHSLGSLIAYESLSRTLPPELANRINTFISVGSPLDKMNLFVDVGHRFRFESSLSTGTTWVNIYSATDLISDHLEEYGERPRNIRVGNKSVLLFFKEHSTYWENPNVMQEIISRVSRSEVLTSRPRRTRAQVAREWAEFYLPENLPKVR